MYFQQDFLDQLTQFLEESKSTKRFSRTWISTDILKVYVRTSMRRLDDKQIRTCFDIASIEVAEEYRRKGIFTATVQKIHAIHPFEATYLENVHAQEIQHWPEKYGWTKNLYDKYSYYLLKC